MGNIRNLKTAIPDLPDLVYTQVFINGSEVDVVKLNGTTYFRTNEAPTITYVTKTQTSITFKITNNNISARRIYYEIGDTTPDLAYVDLGANEQSVNIVISGLTAGTNYTLYARSYYIAETDSSDVTAYTFTTAALQTAKPTIYNTAKTYIKPNYVVSWRVTNNDALVATIYTEIGDSTPDINYGSCASGSYITANETKTPIDFPVTIYAKAQASGKTLSTYDSEVVY